MFIVVGCSYLRMCRVHLTYRGFPLQITRVQVNVCYPFSMADACLWAQRRGWHLWHGKVDICDMGRLAALIVLRWFSGLRPCGIPQHWSHGCPKSCQDFYLILLSVSKAMTQLFSCSTNVCWIEFIARAVTFFLDTWFLCPSTILNRCSTLFRLGPSKRCNQPSIQQHLVSPRSSVGIWKIQRKGTMPLSSVSS